jgi:hypothetical protein
MALNHPHHLFLLFIPSALTTGGPCKSRPHARASSASTDGGREPKGFYDGPNK